MQNGERYPRSVRPYERDLLLWVLPEERVGYREYRSCVQQWDVVARGRRGEGNFIIAQEGEVADNESPLPQVLAYGVVETTAGALVVSVRERLGNQMEFEIQSIRGTVDPRSFEEVRRWTFSTWLPQQPCPICGQQAREVPMRTEGGQLIVLAICPRDRRLWVYDDAEGVNHPMPITNFYNELMLHKNIRTPEIALHPQRLFDDLDSYSDLDFTQAFQTYNQIRTKVPFEGAIVVRAQRRGLLSRLKSLLGIAR